MIYYLQRDSDEQTPYSVLLQNAETVALVCPGQGRVYSHNFKFRFSESLSDLIICFC